MKISLGELSRYGIESELGSDLDDAVRAALSHYRGKIEAGRPPLPSPRFLESRAPAGGETMIDVSVDPETEIALAREARAQGIDVDRLAAHSVLVYLAEFDFLASSTPAV